MTKVSVIVAAYNVEQYIEDTLHSLVNQTMQEAEFIIVDDCSTDKTGDIIKSYVEFDNRIKYIRHAENKGTMLTCKTGCDAACGEYIMFLDGDDALDFKACETAYDAVKKAKVDILQFGIKICGDEETLQKSQDVIDGFKNYLGTLTDKIIAPGKAGLLGNSKSRDTINFTMRNKIFKKSVVDSANSQIPDEYLILAEDILFAYIACFYAKSYCYINDELYYYRIGSGTSTSGKLTESRIKSLSKSYYIYDFLLKWTEKQNAVKLCESRLNIIKEQMLRNVGTAFLAKTSNEKKEIILNEILKYCPVEDLISIASYMSINDYIICPDCLAEICNGLKIFKTTKTAKKTIGMYYYRMYNGGIENVISLLTDILVKNGYDVVIFTDKKEHENDYYINPKITRVVLPEYTPGKFNSYEKRINFFRNSLKSHNIDIMVYHAWMNPQLLADELIIKSLGIPIVVHTHGVFCADTISISPIAAHNNTTLHKIYSLSDVIIALNEIDRVYWSALGHKSIHTINPVAYNKDIRTSNSNGKEVVVVSRISQVKQTLDAVKVMEKVAERIPEASFTIVGTGDDIHYVNEVKAYIKENKLDKIINMAGYQKDVFKFYQSADVILSTSKYEGAPLVFVESKLCGLPLVTYNLANLDTVREAKGMFVVEQGDIEGAAEKIIEILTNDDLKKKMGKEARESGEKIIDFDIAKHWDYIFEQAISPKEESSQKSDVSTALDILLDFTAEGILLRGSNVTIGNPVHTAALEATIKEIRSSTSYRLGWFLTTIPRKIKDFIKGQKYVE